MTKNPYFQFPLCLLSYGESAGQRLTGIIVFAAIEAGLKLWKKLSADEQEGHSIGFRMWEDCPDGANWDNPFHCAALHGAEVIGINFGHFPSSIDRHNRLRTYIANFESRHGRDAKVRIKKNWVFKARDAKGLTYREFAVLCAIYSAIGDKKLTIITRERIRRCALGYRSNAILNAELSSRADKAQLLTERQLRDTIARLHRNKFFARCTVFRRITYYSIRLDNDALRKMVIERRTYSDFFRASQSAQDQLLTNAIKQKRREAAKPAPEAPSLAPRFKFNLPSCSS